MKALRFLILFVFLFCGMISLASAENATFSFATNTMHIPVVELPDGSSYEVQLVFDGNAFVLTVAEPLNTLPAGTFDLSKLSSHDPNISYAFNLTGYDTAGGDYVGTVLIANRPPVLIDNQNAYVEESFFSLTNVARQAFVSDMVFYYYTLDGYPIKSVTQGTNDVCRPSVVHMPPHTARIGDFGIETSWTCTDGTFETGTWRLDDNGDGNARLVTTTNLTGSTVASIEETTVINRYGDFVSTNVRFYYPDLNVTVFLQGDIIRQ